MSNRAKKLLAFLLAAVMIMSLFCLKAFGASVFGDGTGSATGGGPMKGAIVPVSKLTEQQELAKVTLAVKKTLGIDDSYTDFYGEPTDSYLRKVWDLNWSKDKETIHVRALSSGKIISYRYSNDDIDYVSYRSDYSYDPKFPVNNDEAIEKAIKGFMGKVLTSDETYTYSESNYTWYSYDNSKRFRGEIKLNGIDSPMTFSVSVTELNGKYVVSSFSRDDESNYPGKIDKPDNISLKATESAKSLLKSIIEFDIHWEVNEDGETASLKYYPNFDNDMYVDAKTGKLVSIKDVRTLIDNEVLDKEYSNSTTGATAEMASDTGLSEVERGGIDKLDGMLTKEQLDTKIKSLYPELKLSNRNYTLADVSYRLDPETNEITASLLYSRAVKYSDDYNTTERKTVVVDAKTGILKSVYGWDGDSKVEVKAKSETAKKIAEDFAKKVWPTEFGTMELYIENEATTQASGYRYTFAQKHEGYFLPSNTITVTVSCIDNAIIRLDKSYTDVKFNSISNKITEDRAKDIWLNSYSLNLSYIPVPTSIDLIGKDYLMEGVDYKELGYEYMYNLVLGYMMNHRDQDYRSIDAVTGNLDTYSWGKETDGIVYNDLSNNSNKAEFERLAGLEIGWWDGKSTGTLTQVDMIKLLASVDGYSRYSSEQDNTYAYQWAYLRNIITKEERNDNKQITNLEAIKMLVNALGYKKVATIGNMYTSNTADFKSANTADKGYVAIAENLGIIKSDGHINDAATRQSGLMALYNYMDWNSK